MPRARPPINPAVLKWAIDESGYSEQDVADSVDVDVTTLAEWVGGDGGPTQGQFTTLAGKLRRPKSIFFLPRPPEASGLPPALRRAVGRTQRELGATEILWVRRARRLQRLLSLLERDASAPRVAMPSRRTSDDPAGAGAELRVWLGVTVEEQLGWASPREAFEAWREAAEVQGVIVMELQLGSEGLRGFALADDFAPVVAVNTHENVQARIFTVVHELAHLMSETAKACLEVTREAERTERWCDEVASAAVLPRNALREALEGLADTGQPDFEAVRELAERFNVSLRATAMALIRSGLGEADLYEDIEERAPAADFEKGFGRSREPRRAPRQRFTEVGPRAASSVLAAVQSGRLSELDARRHLRLDGPELADLANEIGMRP